MLLGVKYRYGASILKCSRTAGYLTLAAFANILRLAKVDYRHQHKVNYVDLAHCSRE